MGAPAHQLPYGLQGQAQLRRRGEKFRLALGCHGHQQAATGLGVAQQLAAAVNPGMDVIFRN